MIYKKQESLLPPKMLQVLGARKRGRFGGNAWTIASDCLLERLLAW